MISLRLFEKDHQFYDDNFNSITQGCFVVLSAFPTLFKKEVHSLKEIFTTSELCLMLDVGVHLMPQILGSGILIQVQDCIDIDRLDKKWGVDRDSIVRKIKDLTNFQSACLEVWCRAYWAGEYNEKENGFSEYSCHNIDK